MPALQQIGLEGVFVLQAFQKGYTEYVKMVSQVSDKTTQTASTINEAGASMGTGIGTATMAFTTFAGVAVLAIGAVVAGVGALVTATAALALEASKVELVSIAFESMASSVNLSLEDLRQAVRGTVSDDDLMTLATNALVGSGQELAKEFGEHMPQVMEIARSAAKSTGKNFEEVMSTIDNAIKRGATRGLWSTGIIVDQKAAYLEYAQSIGVAVDALSEEQQGIAILNQVLKKGQSIVDMWGNSQMTASERMQQAKAAFANTADTLGTYFLPALNTVWTAIAKFAQALEKAVSAGGALEPILVYLGAALSIMADGFAYGVQKVLDWATSLGEGMKTEFDGTAESAYEWGSELITNFVQGMFDAANSAVESFFSWLNGVFASFMAPGSPPKFLPELDIWGAETMNAFLEGFSKADFSILKDLQGPIKDAMGLLAGKGVNVEAAWAGISQLIAGGLAGGNFSEALAAISASTGMYGDEIVQLAKDEWALKQSTDAVTAAELRLKNAQKSYSDTNLKLSKQLQEYNALLRGGASKDVLAAKLAEINATETQAKAAETEISAASEGVDTAKEQNNALKEQVELQKQLVATFLEMAKAQQEANAPEKAGAGAGGPVTPGAGAGMSFGGIDMTELNAKIEEAKRILKANLGNTFKELGALIKRDWDALWITIGNNINALWNMSIQPALEQGWSNIQAAWTGYEAWVNALLAQGWSNIKAAWDGFSDFIGAVLITMTTRILIGWTNIWNFLVNIWNQMGTNLQAAWNGYLAWIDASLKKIATVILIGWANILGFINRTLDTIRVNLEAAWNGITALTQTVFNNIVAFVKKTWDDIAAGVVTGWETIKANILAGLNGISGFISNMVTIGRNLIQGLWDGVAARWDQFIRDIQARINTLPGVVKRILGIESPSKVFFGIGENIGLGMAQGLDSVTGVLSKSVAGMTMATMRPVMATTPVSTRITNNSNTVNLNASINSGMDEAKLEILIERAISRRLR